MLRSRFALILGSAVALTATYFVPARSEQQGQSPPPANHRPKERPAEKTKTSVNKVATVGAGQARAADEAAIRANIDAFVKAYNAGDAKAVAALFSPDAVIVTSDGRTVEGRPAIEEGFAEVFDETPQVTMQVDVESLQFVGPDLAIETGSTKEFPAPGETPEYGRYTVLHVRRDGKWIMAAARDTEGDPPTNHERLLPLAWLVGEWIDDGGSSVVRTTCQWSDDKNFLLQDMTVQIAGQDAMRVTQRIGWDPLNKRIRSWVFDTEGGFSEGIWARDGDTWMIKSTGVRSDGVAASATSVITPTSKDGYLWQIRDRIVGDEVQPPVDARIARKPPAAADAD